MTCYFIKYGSGNIYDQNGNESTDIVDEEGDHIVAKQLSNLEMYLKKNLMREMVVDNSRGSDKNMITSVLERAGRFTKCRD
jgi:hypothetical protein